MVSVHQESEHDLAECLCPRVCPAAITVSLGLQSQLKAQVGHILVRLAQVAAGRVQVLGGWWWDATLSSEPHRLQQTRGQEMVCAQAFCHLLSEVTSHHFCHIVFIRSKSLVPLHTSGEGITQWCDYQGGRDH